ncbi:phosphoribosylaminoimidazolesuccinocarboxamide synthase [bacterium]|nr:phosphoribosylaminoimidazolesuccinocarboxamide synthase [bacterium]
MEALITTTIKNYPLIRKGKVRDIYQIDDHRLLIIATDRISAFDSILPNGIPGRGKILNQMSVFWFKYTEDIIPNHLLAWRVKDYPTDLIEWEDELEGRSMLVKIADRIDIECVVRGYLAGSGWRSYQKNGTVCGIKLPEGLGLSARLPEPIFTPSTKAETGHDENISFHRMSKMIDPQLAEKLKETSLALYIKARDYALDKNIIIADTKFEFGLLKDKLILIDEALSPDSSRFWNLLDWEEGVTQKSYDKEYIREYLRSIGWMGDGPIPTLPPEVVEGTLKKYNTIFKNLVPPTFFEKA